MKFSGKMCLKIILKATKNQGFTPFSRFRVKNFKVSAALSPELKQYRNWF